MKTLKVLLKQHTPLIHFQHDQDGATLRASEVKPKLDKFIVENEFNNDYGRCKKYLVGYRFSKKEAIEDREREEKILNESLRRKFEEQNFRALNYKVRIHATDINEKILLNEFPRMKFNRDTKENEQVFETEAFPLILCNMGGKKDKEDLMNFSFSKYVEADFTFLDRGSNLNIDDLCEVINRLVVCLFANTNFGQRSNKGFGSFTVDKINDTKVLWNHNEFYEDDTQLMKYEVSDKADDGVFERTRKLFAVIDFYWKCLKSGVNCTNRDVISPKNVRRCNADRYVKSYLWTYLDGCGLTWEKKKVKTGLNLESVRAIGDAEIVPNLKPSFFARAHLGCPVKKITYRVAQGTTINRGGRPMENTDNIDVSIENNRAHEIERIASPIIFKPVFCTAEENGIIKNIVYIYVLYDKQLLDALHRAPNVDFSFKRKGFPDVNLPLFLNDVHGNRILLDYHKLIKQFHSNLGFKMVARDFRWNNVLNNKEVLFRRIAKKK